MFKIKLQTFFYCVIPIIIYYFKKNYGFAIAYSVTNNPNNSYNIWDLV